MPAMPRGGVFRYQRSSPALVQISIHQSIATTRSNRIISFTFMLPMENAAALNIYPTRCLLASSCPVRLVIVLWRRDRSPATRIIQSHYCPRTKAYAIAFMPLGLCNSPSPPCIVLQYH